MLRIRSTSHVEKQKETLASAGGSCPKAKVHHLKSAKEGWKLAFLWVLGVCLPQANFCLSHISVYFLIVQRSHKGHRPLPK